MARKRKLTGADVDAAARTWLETPFHHQGRVKGAGVDCIGLIVGVARDLGLPVQDKTNYGRRPEGARLRDELTAQLIRADEPAQGCVLLFRILHDPQHVAILTARNTIIHALDPVGKVVEHTLDEAWRKRLIGVYRYPGVA